MVRLSDISSKTGKKCIFCVFWPFVWMGLNFQYYDGLQPKIRAGILNEHECIKCDGNAQLGLFRLESGLL